MDILSLNYYRKVKLRHIMLEFREESGLKLVWLEKVFALHGSNMNEEQLPQLR